MVIFGQIIHPKTGDQMSAYLTTVKITQNGRITLCSSALRNLGVKTGDELDMQATHFATLQTSASNPSFQRMLRGPLKFKSNANSTPQTETLLSNVELRSKNPAQVEQRIDKLLVINIVI